jgi:hypothetical protein
VRAAKLAVAVTCAGLLFATAAAATAPGSAQQVSALVGASVHIDALDATTSSELAAAPTDFSWAHYPKLGGSSTSSCLTATSCVYGDRKASKTVVLFGDSHALMWLPAIAPAVTAHKERLVVLWTNLCPVASVQFYDPPIHDPAHCDSWRAATVRIINKLAPSLVIIGERTDKVASGPYSFFTNEQWQAGLTTTIRKLQKGTTKIAVIESVVAFNSFVPECLAAYANDVQRCSENVPRTSGALLQQAQINTAKATGSLFVRAASWFCARKACSPVIGNFIVAIDTGHISFSYAKYLSVVMGSALKGDL